ncbi:unnamed protein product [Darwinula stevensoni]|uniref:RING-type domain-containing protein n=1 Tax=Darwinula stevensoni TaxID=69355 RepID=A0A7R8XDP3_9CRUS|nr:unnamed protein product [Darwinula stevensoni]CAG0888890.1 unnamed protein product [Darwinula stevensoni]
MVDHDKERGAARMSKATRIQINEINPHILCPLCGGYLIEATTIVECLHSFCRSCLVKYLDSSRSCPICDVQIHKAKPLLNIKVDKTLQDIVYKLVPGLFQNEMQRRRTFYAEHPENTPSDKEESGDASDQRYLVYTAGDHFSISLTLENPPPDTKVVPRFFLCPAMVSVGSLKKLISHKYGLPSVRQVVVSFNEEPLVDDDTLIDIAYNHQWKKIGPMDLTFRIVERGKKRRRNQCGVLALQPMKKRLKDEGLASASPVKRICDREISPSLQRSDAKGSLDTSVSVSPSASACDKTRVCDSIDREKPWKEVQLQISETGIMSFSQPAGEAGSKRREKDSERDEEDGKSTSVNASVGYKTLKVPPKSWNPSVSPSASKGQPKVNAPTPVELTLPKPPKIFKVKHMPRYLQQKAHVEDLMQMRTQDQEQPKHAGSFSQTHKAKPSSIKVLQSSVASPNVTGVTAKTSALLNAFASVPVTSSADVTSRSSTVTTSSLPIETKSSLVVSSTSASKTYTVKTSTASLPRNSTVSVSSPLTTVAKSPVATTSTLTTVAKSPVASTTPTLKFATPTSVTMTASSSLTAPVDGFSPEASLSTHASSSNAVTAKTSDALAYASKTSTVTTLSMPRMAPIPIAPKSPAITTCGSNARKPNVTTSFITNPSSIGTSKIPGTTSGTDCLPTPSASISGSSGGMTKVTMSSKTARPVTSSRTSAIPNVSQVVTATSGATQKDSLPVTISSASSTCKISGSTVLESIISSPSTGNRTISVPTPKSTLSSMAGTHSPRSSLETARHSPSKASMLKTEGMLLPFLPMMHSPTGVSSSLTPPPSSPHPFHTLVSLASSPIPTYTTIGQPPPIRAFSYSPPLPHAAAYYHHHHHHHPHTHSHLPSLLSPSGPPMFSFPPLPRSLTPPLIFPPPFLHDGVGMRPALNHSPPSVQRMPGNVTRISRAPSIPSKSPVAASSSPKNEDSCSSKAGKKPTKEQEFPQKGKEEKSEERASLLCQENQGKSTGDEHIPPGKTSDQKDLLEHSKEEAPKNLKSAESIESTKEAEKTAAKEGNTESNAIESLEKESVPKGEDTVNKTKSETKEEERRIEENTTGGEKKGENISERGSKNEERSGEDVTKDRESTPS